MLETLPLHGIQLVLYSVNHIQTHTVMQEDDAVSEITQNSEQTKRHALGSTQASCIQPGLPVMPFSHLWTNTESPQGLYIHSRQQCAVGCGTVKQRKQQPKDFSADGIHLHVHEWDFCLNACDDFFYLLL